MSNIPVPVRELFPGLELLLEGVDVPEPLLAGLVPHLLWLSKSGSFLVVRRALNVLVPALSPEDRAILGEDALMQARRPDISACRSVAEYLIDQDDANKLNLGRSWLWIAASYGDAQSMMRLAREVVKGFAEAPVEVAPNYAHALAADWLQASDLIETRLRAMHVGSLGEAAKKNALGGGSGAGAGGNTGGFRPPSGGFRLQGGKPASRPAGPAANDPAHAVLGGARPVSRGRTLPEVVLEAQRVQDNMENDPVMLPPDAIPFDDLHPEDGVRLLDAITDDAPPTRNQGELARRFGNLLLPLPLHGGGSDPATVQRRLDAQYPWMRHVTKWVVGRIALNRSEGRKGFHLPPLLLVGRPGCGKSDYLARLAEEVGVKSRVIAVGATSDGRLIDGTSRAFANPVPGLVPFTASTLDTANPYILFDELEKGSGNRQSHGSIQDSLLALLEPSTASRLYDGCLCGNVDASTAIYVATANALDALQKPLLDRFHVLAVPSPGPEHLEAILGSMRLRDAARLGVRVETLRAPEPPEMEWLREQLARSRSIRALRKAYDALRGLWAEEAEPPMQAPGLH